MTPPPLTQGHQLAQLWLSAWYLLEELACLVPCFGWEHT